MRTLHATAGYDAAAKYSASRSQSQLASADALEDLALVASTRARAAALLDEH